MLGAREPGVTPDLTCFIDREGRMTLPVRHAWPDARSVSSRPGRSDV